MGGHHLTAGAQKQPMQQSTPWPQIYKQINLMQFHLQSHKAGLTLPLLAGLTVCALRIHQEMHFLRFLQMTSCCSSYYS